MKKIIITSIIALLPLFLSAQNTWQKRTSFPASKRARSVAFTIGTRGYLATGEDTLDIEKNDLWEYDPGSDSWTQKANMPGAGRRDAIGFAIGNKGYVGTGIDASISQLGNTLNDFWEYSPLTNTWTSKAPFPGAFNQGVYMATAFVVNSKGYVCGGKIGPSSYSDELWEYTPGSNSWIQKTSFPAGVRVGQSSFALNGMGYVGCGTDENWMNNDFWQYNPSNDQWMQKANFPGTQRAYCSAFSLGTKGYMGFGEDGGYQNDWYEYDDVNNHWSSKGNLGSEGRRSAPTFVITGAGYVMCGKGNAGKHRDLWEYEPYVIGVEENSDVVSMNVFPNPATDIIHFEIDENFIPSHPSLSIQLINLEGKIVATKPLNGKSQIEMQNENWATGTYLYTLTDGTKNYGGGQIIIR